MTLLKLVNYYGTRMIFAAAFVLPWIAGVSGPVAADGNDGGPGAVYTITNAASGNEVTVYKRAANGSLSFEATYATDGLGSGAGLGSQGAVALSQNGRWLFAVNAGSNEVSVFAVRERGLALVDVVDSGGEMPISLTTHDGLLYVLNAGGSGNITGFRVRENGMLEPLDSSTQPLSNGGSGDSPGPAQISFDPEGEFLVVTEKMTNLIDVYRVRRRIADPPVTSLSAGETPFGFAFDRRGRLIVSEAFGGAPEASAMSSYRLDDKALKVISPSVGTTQTAACWVVVSKNGKYAYTTNTGSGSISSYRIERNGALTLLDPQAGLIGFDSSPIDMAISSNGRYLYALGSGSHTISIFRLNEDGSLEPRGEVSVPEGAVGLAAR
jgi:6-phosphogluconolactonase (cycloisomerase 2 family)